jgi:hypothetical protein
MSTDVSATCHVDCWLNVKHERKCAPALKQFVERARWPAVAWETPVRDQERGLYHVQGSFKVSAASRSAVIVAVLEDLTRVTNHCVVGGPRYESDGSWEFSASADGRQLEMQQFRMLSVTLSGT